jgi:hypothetical protein
VPRLTVPPFIVNLPVLEALSVPIMSHSAQLSVPPFITKLAPEPLAPTLTTNAVEIIGEFIIGEAPEL